jgi:Co/Zn/Cd efflux system component
MSTASKTTMRYFVTGMDCSDCAHKIEKATRAVAGVDDVHVSIASQIMTVQVADESTQAPQIEHSVTALGYKLDRLSTDGSSADDKAIAASHLTPSYRRALWTVVILNAGYGLIEIVGGVLSDSQALKADALDFLGDGLITFLGIIAIGWGLVWRARSALVQGIFLGVLGLGVLGNTLLRLRDGYTPESELMGLFAIVALGINIAAALVLMPHRTGDANARAVWLFSRNDALGNLAVVIAAGFVAVLDSAWPDLIVAFVISGLFLQSSLSIIRDARHDLGASRTQLTPAAR